MRFTFSGTPFEVIELTLKIYFTFFLAKNPDMLGAKKWGHSQSSVRWCKLLRRNNVLKFYILDEIAWS